MKIKLLGTAAFEGIPALFCSCETCRESRKLGGKNIRKRSSALVDDKIAFDFTNDTLSHIINFNLDFSKLEYLFVTHSHSDHFNYADLEAKMKWFVNPGNPVLNVYGNEKCIELLASHLKTFENYDDYMRLKVTKHFEEVHVDDYKITPIPARHITYFPEEATSIYVIEHEGKKVLYGLDSGWYYDNTWNYLENTYWDCLILDCTNGFLKFEPGNHMGFEDNLMVVKRLREKGAIDNNTKIISTHFSHNGKVIYDRDCDLFKDKGIIMSYDGMEILI